jgi:hypothetical protein
MSSNTAPRESTDLQPAQADSSFQEKSFEDVKHIEHVLPSTDNLVYDHDNEEPELHARTYLAVAAMFLLNLVQVLALQAPPAVVCIGHDAYIWTRLSIAAYSFLTSARISTTRPPRRGCPTHSHSFKPYLLPSSHPPRTPSRRENSSSSALL